MKETLKKWPNPSATGHEQTEQGLSGDKAEFVKAFWASPGLMCIISLNEERLIDINEAGRLLTGYSREELIGRTAAELNLWQDKAGCTRMLKEVLERGCVHDLEIELRRKSGEIRSLLLAGETTILRNEPCLICVAMDITESKQAETLYRTLAKSSPVGIYIVQNGKFCFVNPQFQRYTGFSESKLLETESLEIVHPEDRKRVRENAIAMLKGNRQASYELRYIVKGGKTMWAMETVVPIRYKGRRATLGNFMDISERKQMEQQLKQQMDELQSAHQKLQELDKMKDNFLSAVSHELRTPLTSIKSFAEILLDYEEDRETQKEFLGIINEESDRLTRLINDVLDLAKIEAGRMQWEKASLAMPDIIETATNGIHALAARGNLKVYADMAPDLPPVWGDKDRLVQVLTNLLGNAIKFTPDGGEIRIAAQHIKGNEASDTADMIQVSVTDNGIGISAKDQRRLFRKFQQAGNMLTDKPTGTGLGLAICKEIVGQYGGKIWAESETGKGSTFFFTLPAVNKTGPGNASGKEEVAANASAVKTVLVVDDEANIRRFLNHELTHSGHHVIEASGGKEAIELTRKYHPDLVTLDVLMPDITGLDVTTVLKGNADTKDIPILVLSITEEREDAYQKGADSYLTKPFNTELLMNEVARLLAQNKKKILVADDDRALVKAIRFGLKKRGFKVFAAYNGQEALKIIEDNRPDLIVLDITMPKMDGYEVISALKPEPETADIPIIVLTGMEVEKGKDKLLSLGATEYITKSSGTGKLFELIDNILGTRHGD